MSAKSTDARIQANRRYNDKNLAQLRAWYNKNNDSYNERIETAVKAGKAKSKQEYIIEAVRSKLEIDGF